MVIGLWYLACDDQSMSVRISKKQYRGVRLRVQVERGNNSDSSSSVQFGLCWMDAILHPSEKGIECNCRMVFKLEVSFVSIDRLWITTKAACRTHGNQTGGRASMQNMPSGKMDYRHIRLHDQPVFSVRVIFPGRVVVQEILILIPGHLVERRPGRVLVAAIKQSIYPENKCLCTAVPPRGSSILHQLENHLPWRNHNSRLLTLFYSQLSDIIFSGRIFCKSSIRNRQFLPVLLFRDSKLPDGPLTMICAFRIFSSRSPKCGIFPLNRIFG